MTVIKPDCRHFKGDVPCTFHKDEGVHCVDCRYYDPVSLRILIIKLDAVGDVLRTTAILQGLKDKYKNSWVAWLTRRESFPLFINNGYVDELLDYTAESFQRLQVENYDLVINLDAAPKSARLAEAARGKVKKGFGYNQRGYVYPFNEEARTWFEMGVFDDIKRENRRTYQEITLDICGLKPKRYDIILNLTEGEKEFGRRFAEKNSISRDRPVIGFNTGAGSRWKKKKWTLEGYLELFRLLADDLSPTILLFGGPLEVKRNRYLIANSPCRLIDAGCDNTLREFASIVDICDVVVTGDTLALHVAVALKKKVVALFGPTSSYEIDLYGRGKKIIAEKECLCCYRLDCDVEPDCMTSIRAESVMNAIRDVLRSA